MGKYYFLQGYIRNTSSSNVLIYNDETAKMLVCKLSTANVKAYNCYWWSNTITNKPVNQIFVLDTNGDINSFSYQSLEIRQFNHSGSRYQGPITIFAPDVSGETGQILQAIKDNKPHWIDNPAPRTISNIIVSNWIADTTYTDFGYKADISIANLTENDTCEVIFNQADASSGNYAQVNSSSAGTLTIYSKVNTEITIPTIIIIKGGY